MNGALVWLRNTGNGGSSAFSANLSVVPHHDVTSDTGHQSRLFEPSFVTVADMDGDGDCDIVVVQANSLLYDSGYYDAKMIAWINTTSRSAGSTEQPEVTGTGVFGNTVVIADVIDCGNPDRLTVLATDIDGRNMQLPGLIALVRPRLGVRLLNSCILRVFVLRASICTVTAGIRRWRQGHIKFLRQRLKVVRKYRGWRISSSC